ncbi:MAG: PIN domain nuclease [Candidatus Sumerlaeota bacterium]
MIVLVDTTVWIDFFAGRNLPHVAALECVIEEGEDLALCGIVLCEILQGIRKDSEFCKTKTFLEDLLYLPMERPSFIRSAELYRTLRKRGITIRKPLDCMIASVCMEHDATLLHNDRDFDSIAKHSQLSIFDFSQRA